jgi:hypothetical protein
LLKINLDLLLKKTLRLNFDLCKSVLVLTSLVSLQIKPDPELEPNPGSIPELNLGTFSVQFDLSLPMDDDFEEEPTSDIRPVIQNGGLDGFTRYVGH